MHSGKRKIEQIRANRDNLKREVRKDLYRNLTENASREFELTSNEWDGVCLNRVGPIRSLK